MAVLFPEGNVESDPLTKGAEEMQGKLVEHQQERQLLQPPPFGWWATRHRTQIVTPLALVSLLWPIAAAASLGMGTGSAMFGGATDGFLSILFACFGSIFLTASLMGESLRALVR